VDVTINAACTPALSRTATDTPERLSLFMGRSSSPLCWISSSRILSVPDQPFGGDLHFSLALLEYFLFTKPLFYPIIMDIIGIVVALPDVRYRQRVQKRLTRLRKRLLAFVIKANPECFDHGGRLAPGCFPARIPPEATDLHRLMRRAECKLAMIRCHAECAIGKS